MATQQDLDAAIQSLKTAIAAQGQEISDAIASASATIQSNVDAVNRLLAKIAAGNPPLDLTAEVNDVSSSSAAIQATLQSLTDIKAKLDAQTASNQVEGV